MHAHTHAQKRERAHTASGSTRHPQATPLPASLWRSSHPVPPRLISPRLALLGLSTRLNSSRLAWALASPHLALFRLALPLASPRLSPRLALPCLSPTRLTLSTPLSTLHAPFPTLPLSYSNHPPLRPLPLSHAALKVMARAGARASCYVFAGCGFALLHVYACLSLSLSLALCVFVTTTLVSACRHMFPASVLFPPPRPTHPFCTPLAAL